VNFRIDDDFDDQYKLKIRETLTELSQRLYEPTGNETIEIIPLEENPWAEDYKKAGVSQSAFVLYKEPFHNIIYDEQDGSLPHEVIHIIHDFIRDKNQIATPTGEIGHPRRLSAFLTEGAAELFSLYEDGGMINVDNVYISNFKLTEDEENFLNGLKPNFAKSDLVYTYFVSTYKEGRQRHPEGLLMASEAIPAIQRVAASSQESDLESIRDTMAKFLMSVNPWKSPQYAGGGEMANKLINLGCDVGCIDFGKNSDGVFDYPIKDIIGRYSNNIELLPDDLPEKSKLRMLLDDISVTYEQNEHLDNELTDRVRLVEMLDPKISELNNVQYNAFERVTFEGKQKPTLISEILDDLSKVNTQEDLDDLFDKWYVVNSKEENSPQASLERTLEEYPELDTPAYRRSFLEQFS